MYLKYRQIIQLYMQLVISLHRKHHLALKTPKTPLSWHVILNVKRKARGEVFYIKGFIVYITRGYFETIIRRKKVYISFL